MENQETSNLIVTPPQTLLEAINDYDYEGEDFDFDFSKIRDKSLPDFEGFKDD